MRSKPQASCVPAAGAGVRHSSAETVNEPVRAEGAKLSRTDCSSRRQYLIACVGNGLPWSLAKDWMVRSSTLGVVVVAAARRTPAGCSLFSPDAMPARCQTSRSSRLFDLSPLTTAETDELITALDPTLSDQRASRSSTPLRRDTALHRRGRQPSCMSSPQMARGRARVPDAPVRAAVRASSGQMT